MTDRVRVIAQVLGSTYIAVGVVGFFVTGFDGFFANGDDALLIFDLNGFHNVVHIGVGALWLAAAQLPRPEDTEGVHLGIGLVYLLATFLGAVGALEILSIDDNVFAPDNFLHLASALAALAAGFSARGAISARAAG